MLQCPSDSILVEIKAKYEEEIHYASGVKLYLDPSFNPNFHATVEGVVHSVPVSLRENQGIKAIIQPGDEVLFSYRTVGDITFQGNTDLFRMTTKGEGYLTEWMNQERETIRIVKGMKEHQWSALFIDRRGDLVAGKNGNHGECENWIATNFKFASSEGFEYDNRLQYQDKELWKVDYSFVFAIRRNGHMIMVGDYCLVEPIVENLPERILVGGNMLRPEHDRFTVRENKGWLRNGNKGELHNGDVVYFDPNMKEKYNIQGQPWYIVKRQFILGKENNFVGLESLSVN